MARTRMTTKSGQTQGWSFSLEYDDASILPSSGSMAITAVTTSGTQTDTVQNGGPPDTNNTAIRAGYKGYTQGVVIDNNSVITLNPASNFVTSKACYRITMPSSAGTYQAHLIFTHNVGNPRIDSVISQNGLSKYPCAKNFTFTLNVHPNNPITTGGCSIAGGLSGPTGPEGPLGPLGPEPPPPATPFSCADANGDAMSDISDAIYVLSFLFLGESPPCHLNTSRTLQTRQVICFSDFGFEVPCSNTAFFGQDAMYRNIVGLARNYVDNTNGTVTDVTTQLMWTKDHSPVVQTFDAAQNVFVAGLNNESFAGFNDWRVPTIRELMSIVDFSRFFVAADPNHRGAIDPLFTMPVAPFPPTAGLRFWSSTDHRAQANQGWYVNFAVGHNWGRPKSAATWVRAVRNLTPPPHVPGPLPAVFPGTTMTPPQDFQLPFTCGDVNSDGTLNITDPIFTLSFLFQGGTPPCIVEKPILPLVGFFLDNGNGTVTDRRNGLVWEKTPLSERVSWKVALALAEGLDLADQEDWRLPNAYELSTIVEYTKATAPFIDPIFALPTGGPLIFWSSTSSQQEPHKAWCCHLDDGRLHDGFDATDKDFNMNFFRAVRGGKVTP